MSLCRGKHPVPVSLAGLTQQSWDLPQSLGPPQSPPGLFRAGVCRGCRGQTQTPPRRADYSESRGQVGSGWLREDGSSAEL